MTGTNHSKTHIDVVVEPRNVAVPGGAAQSISFISIIPPAPGNPLFIFIIPVLHPLPYITRHIVEPFRRSAFRIVTDRGCCSCIIVTKNCGRCSKAKPFEVIILKGNQTRGKSQDPRCNPAAQETSYQAGNAIADAISFCVYSQGVFKEREPLIKKRETHDG